MNDLATAREWSRKHASMLRAERAALADLLLSLAEFEARSLCRDLGYATFFDYLHRELGLSRGMSHYRQVAARLVQKFPEIEEPIRDGRLCLTTVVELARAITPENRAEVLPRFFNLSRDEAKQVAAEIAPREVVPRRTVVTQEPAQSSSTFELELTPVMSSSTIELGSTSQPQPPPRTTVEPMTATATRIHLTVSPEFVKLLKRAKTGQSHVQPNATDEQVLTAALELLLEKQSKRKSCVPVKVKQDVMQRDEGRCTWPTHDGGVCGSTVRLEVDHVVPRGRGGEDSTTNCRLLCDLHNQEAARQVYGDAHMDLFTRTPRAGEGVASYAVRRDDPTGLTPPAPHANPSIRINEWIPQPPPHAPPASWAGWKGSPTPRGCASSTSWSGTSWAWSSSARSCSSRSPP